MCMSLYFGYNDVMLFFQNKENFNWLDKTNAIFAALNLEA